jgi:hypothetical protein
MNGLNFVGAKQSAPPRVKARMTPETPSRREMLDRDLQIVRVTLAAISPDVRDFSAPAADAIEEALERLDSAQQAFARKSGDW